MMRGHPDETSTIQHGRHDRDGNTVNIMLIFCYHKLVDAVLLKLEGHKLDEDQKSSYPLASPELSHPDLRPCLL